ncbi:MAG: hypothetical protein M5U09_17665 [Gammaproteobacteria bacterium]|nr:hypothetical protein [Gammaproteobacteria bacterium]
MHQPAQVPAGLTPPPPRPEAPARRTARPAMMRMPSAPSSGFGGMGLMGGGGGGRTAPLVDYEEAAPAPRAEPRERAQRSRGDDRAASGTQRCYELARRPDGSIDQDALEACLRGLRGRMKESVLGSRKRARR